jgi:hypothetical protein
MATVGAAIRKARAALGMAMSDVVCSRQERERLTPDVQTFPVEKV